VAADLPDQAIAFHRTNENFPLFFAGKSAAFKARPVPNKGRIMVVIYAGWDAVDAAMSRALLARDERQRCVRRSRVALTPRCWRQVGDDASHHAGDGGKKAGHRGARNKP
jgi:hypothetical protein